MYLRNGLFLCLICLVAQSCVTYSVLPKNISTQHSIEGTYSNISEIDTLKNIGQTIDGAFYLWWKVDSLKHKAYQTQTIWNIFDEKQKIKTDSVNVTIEIVNSKSVKFSFFKDDENIGTKLIKGKFEEDGCFYTRGFTSVIPILPILWAYERGQERIYRMGNELIIETTYSSGAAVIIMASGSDSNKIWKFKLTENR